MRGAEEEKPEEKEYFSYKRCPGCGIKIHVDTYRCWKCGERAKQERFSSTKPEDAKYCVLVNSADKCVNCYNLQHGLKVCEPIFCYATGRGDCKECKILHPARYECCIETQKTDGVPTAEDVRKLLSREILKRP